MKRNYLIGLIFFMMCRQLLASHIVGGEIFLIYKSGNTYQMGLNMYYDEINAASPTLKDDYIRITIFRKKDNAFIQNVDLGYYKGQELITYKNPSCQQYNRVKTSRIYYYTDVTLNSDNYNDAGGYYAVWERCCRNNAITNIANPNQSGNVFYLEFPAVTRDGKSFINSSPKFNVITGDYACVNSPFYFDFSGVDADGDSLVYSLVTPFKGYSVACGQSRFNPCSCPDNCSYPADPVLTSPLGTSISSSPRNHSAPYPLVTWASGYTLQKSTPGPQALGVNSRTGMVTFTPSLLGIYAFAVLCEEYRNGIKIGAVQRDFQIVVIDCPKNYAPVINVKDNKTHTVVAENSTINVKKTDALCFDVVFNDRISSTIFSSSTLTVSIIAVNFSANLVSLSPTSGTVYADIDTIRARLCFDKCAATEKTQPLQLKLVVKDDGCGSGLTDTLSVFFDFERLVQNPPVASTTLPNNEAIVFINQTIKFDVIAQNPETGSLTLTGTGRGFNMQNVGMQFQSGRTGTDSLRVPFTWTPDCSLLNLLKDDVYVIDFVGQNQNCKDKYDTVTVSISLRDSVINYTFAPPNLFTPNEDEWNRYFQMSDNSDSLQNLPKDNCREKFDKIEVYNRWGKLVFTSHDRHFKWEGAGFPSGNYYYLVYYTTRRYKGWISLVR
jgi:gliding motility-associated-like protein